MKKNSFIRDGLVAQVTDIGDFDGSSVIKKITLPVRTGIIRF